MTINLGGRLGAALVPQRGGEALTVHEATLQRLESEQSGDVLILVAQVDLDDIDGLDGALADFAVLADLQRTVAL